MRHPSTQDEDDRDVLSGHASLPPEFSSSPLFKIPRHIFMIPRHPHPHLSGFSLLVLPPLVRLPRPPPRARPLPSTRLTGRLSSSCNRSRIDRSASWASCCPLPANQRLPLTRARRTSDGVAARRAPPPLPLPALPSAHISEYSSDMAKAKGLLRRSFVRSFVRSGLGRG